MTALPPPRDSGRPLRDLARELAGRLGEPATVAECVDLLRGACWHRACGAREPAQVEAEDAAPAARLDRPERREGAAW